MKLPHVHLLFLLPLLCRNLCGAKLNMARQTCNAIFDPYFTVAYGSEKALLEPVPRGDSATPADFSFARLHGLQLPLKCSEKHCRVENRHNNAIGIAGCGGN
ncbi:MAG: hypothetical protein WD795_08995 [Woeseia sp.]